MTSTDSRFSCGLLLPASRRPRVTRNTSCATCGFSRPRQRETALAYYNVHHLTAWFQKQGIVSKFYFIVDRIDLLVQASNEFKSRGLVVHTINSRNAFARYVKSTSAIHNHARRPEITVVRASDYNFDLQRIYFLDEVHRSYNPSGSFLVNLNESDPYAIKNSHDRKLLYSHEKFVEPMLDYIITDFGNTQLRENDASIGTMVICDSADQAKMMAEIFTKKYALTLAVVPASIAEPESEFLRVADDIVPYRFTPRLDLYVRSHALILHGVGTKDQRRQWVKDFKDGEIDILFVYNMLLTGFDA